MMILVSVSLAEKSDAFLLHNGTTFGMSQLEVMVEESNKGFIVLPAEENRLYGQGTIAGRQNGATISYFFSKADSMYQMRYLFFLDMSGGFNQANYDAIDNGLVDKYGETVYSSDTGNSLPVEIPDSLLDLTYTYTNKCPITGQSINNIVFEKKGSASAEVHSYWEPTCRQYKQWLIPLEDGTSIIIDHSYIVEYSKYYYEDMYTGDGDPQSYEQVIYTKLSAEETAKLLKSSEKVKDDL